MIKEAWNRVGVEETGLGSIKEKIKFCGDELLAWGLAKTNPNVEEIKSL